LRSTRCRWDSRLATRAKGLFRLALGGPWCSSGNTAWAPVRQSARRCMGAGYTTNGYIGGSRRWGTWVSRLVTRAKGPVYRAAGERLIGNVHFLFNRLALQVGRAQAQLALTNAGNPGGIAGALVVGGRARSACSSGLEATAAGWVLAQQSVRVEQLDG
jgi:hypothetical protein